MLLLHILQKETAAEKIARVNGPLHRAETEDYPKKSHSFSWLNTDGKLKKAEDKTNVALNIQYSINISVSKASSL